ncbi:hypothetical protein OROMI_010065 [Orobanche minor]
MPLTSHPQLRLVTDRASSFSHFSVLRPEKLLVVLIPFM